MQAFFYLPTGVNLIMFDLFRVKRGLFSAASVLAISFIVMPNVAESQTTAGIRGTISDADGSPLTNAVVKVVNPETGFVREVSVSNEGNYVVRNLPAGTNYDVSISAPGVSIVERGVDLAVGQIAVVDKRVGAVEEIVVLGVNSALVNTAIGPSAIFDADALSNAPSVNRNLNDLIQQDPRLFVDQSRGDIDAVQCNGANPRFNSLTLDGIQLNDGFGLNSNGYPTQRMPFPYDSIASVAVELAPMDVAYGGFSACNINAVTKMGENKLSGSVFMDYGSDALRGDKLEGDDISSQDYEETRFGFELGGALIEDKLFIYGAYEKYNGADLNNRGALGSGAVNEVAVSQEDLDRIAAITQSVYGFDPGDTISRAKDFDDEKYLLKADWYANESQRLSMTYMYNDSYNLNASDGDLDEFEFSKHFYKRGAELTSITGTLFSDWSDVLSTEIRYSNTEVDFLQESVAGKDFAEFRIELADVDVYVGQDDSRQANDLDYELDSFIFKANFDLSEHFVTFGYERQEMDIFNLFYQHVDTEIRFDGIDNYEAGIADRIYYGNSADNNELNAAAAWGYAIDTFYVQDEWQIDDKLIVTYGLRYDSYESDDKPAVNESFLADYGYANNASLDGRDLVMPRLGVKYEFNPTLTLRAGVGQFSGGNPNVWYSNIYSNTNTSAFQVQQRGNIDLFSLDYVLCEANVPTCGPGYGVPSNLATQVAEGGSNFELVYLDPDFDIPSEWKVSFGGTWNAPNGYVINADLIIARGQDTAIYKRGDLAKTGEVTDEGYPVYASVKEPSFVLTNSLNSNESEAFSTSVFKSFDSGLDMRLGYAYTDARDVNPMTSSVAFSNYVNRSFFDPQEDVVSNSNYSMKHRFVGVFNYTTSFFEGYDTRFSLYAQSNSGYPYSITLSGYGGTVGAYGYTPYLDFIENVLVQAGTRNDQEGSWWTKADLRVSQELPGLLEGHKARAFIVIDNVTNFLNDDWGVLEKPNFPFGVTEDDVAAGIAEARIGGASLWEIRMGVNYKF